MAELFIITKDEAQNIYSVSFRELLGYVAGKYGIDKADLLAEGIEMDAFEEMKRAEQAREMINRDILITVVWNCIAEYQNDLELQELTFAFGDAMSALALCDRVTISPVPKEKLNTYPGMDCTY